MDILIKGMEMPYTGRLVLMIDSDMTVFVPNDYKVDINYSNNGLSEKAVALPEHHGRLIDADFFKEYAVRVHTEEGKEYIPADYIDIVPTIVEASK